MRVKFNHYENFLIPVAKIFSFLQFSLPHVPRLVRGTQEEKPKIFVNDYYSYLSMQLYSFNQEERNEGTFQVSRRMPNSWCLSSWFCGH
ncbi:protein of unknown function [Legionella hackeliae]|uniref:Uncharacterized protein n=1 Tax=Legionella hackeliae TaxID=449 RepID=A0A0A8UUU0_LEGHA|nr:protein of unknown function [Legionella hackeliae]